MQSLLAHNVKGKNILLLFVATMIVYAVMLVVTIPELMILSNGKKIIDMMPAGYDTPYVADLMESLGPEGRSYYLTRQLPLDFIYPALFAVTYPLIFIFFLRKINKQATPWRFAAILPVIAGVADYLENICIISIIKDHPRISDGLVQFSSAASVLKASTTTIYFIFLIGLLIGVAIKRLRKDERRKNEINV